MVGNDIVDVIDLEAEVEETRVRFDARICRADEREAIARSSSPSRERWCHWAAKEAAYKLFKKQLPATIFSPIRFEVDLEPEPKSWKSGLNRPEVRRGVVCHGASRRALAIEWVEGSAVHARVTPIQESEENLVVGHDWLQVSSGEPLTPERLSHAVRALACNRIAKRLGTDPSKLSITQRERIPELRKRGVLFGADLSLSHHGRVVAFACRLPSSLLIERLAS
ncbi:MAG: 4'-phosphopantetheinyl transferase superfamily protein [Myxococcota bacterium]|nr:4'-phosphopantetheinyl transferase superfamily protein [Myxococcota bacterium]